MKLKALLVAGLLVAAFSAAASPASASSVTVRHPSDGSWVTVSDLHKVAVCDGDPDGHKTYARIWEWYQPEYTTSGYDTYGNNASGQFCLHFQVGGWGIFKFAVCVQYEGCSAWKQT